MFIAKSSYKARNVQIKLRKLQPIKIFEKPLTQQIQMCKIFAKFLNPK